MTEPKKKIMTPFVWKFLIIGLVIIGILIVGGIVVNGIIEKLPSNDGSHLSDSIIISYENTIAELTGQLSGITEDNRQIGEGVERAESRNRELEEINKNLRENLSSLNSTLSEYEHRFGKLSSDIGRVETEIETLGGSVGASREQADSIGNRNNEIEELVRLAREQAGKLANSNTN